MANLMLNLDDYVRVTQTASEKPIIGRYDGVEYVFPDGEPVDVHKAVACHIFGFGLPEESQTANVLDKTPCLQRLGWLSMSGDKRAALDTLHTHVKFEEIPPFPNVLRLRNAEENSGLLQSESASRVPSSPSMGGGGGVIPAAAPANPEKTLHLPAKAKG